jgi:uncharacterized cupin superfamily protein
LWKIINIKKMHRCSVHYHKNKTETFYVVSGKVLLELDDEVYMLLPGDAVDVNLGQKHRFSGIEDSEIIEFSTHHEDEDSYRDEPSGKIMKEDLRELDNLISLSNNSSDGVIRRVEWRV